MVPRCGLGDKGELEQAAVEMFFSGARQWIAQEDGAGLRTNCTSRLMRRAMKNESATSDMRTMGKVFAIIDDDQTGEFTHDQFKAGLIKMDIAMTEREIDLVLSRLDSDGDGSIDVDEFCEQIGQARESRAATARRTLSAVSNYLSQSGETAAQAFARLDNDGSGTLDLEELHAALNTWGANVSMFSTKGEYLPQAHAHGCEHYCSQIQVLKC